MKGCRFYLEYDSSQSKRKGTVKNPGPHSGNVIAVWLGNNGHPLYHIEGGYEVINQASGEKTRLPTTVIYDAIAAVMDYANSPVGSTGVSEGYLRGQCRRIPERLAREIHPNLFVFLDQ